MIDPEADRFSAARSYHRERMAQQLSAREASRAHWLARAREAILRLAPRYPDVSRVYLFGSITQTGRFRQDSDIDVAIVCDPQTEPAFWRELEQSLQRDIDLRPLKGSLMYSVEQTGELVYER